MPHPAGRITVDYDRSGNALKAEINLPDGISGTFVWKGKSYELKGGKNNLEL
jgi:alpha-L-rhamnosidase